MKRGTLILLSLLLTPVFLATALALVYVGLIILLTMIESTIPLRGVGLMPALFLAEWFAALVMAILSATPLYLFAKLRTNAGPVAPRA